MEKKKTELVRDPKKRMKIIWTKLHFFVGCVYIDLDTGEYRGIIFNSIAAIAQKKINAALVLRPMSSITDKEAAELERLEGHAEKALYLTRKCFDVFGFIEQGAAIEHRSPKEAHTLGREK